MEDDRNPYEGSDEQHADAGGGVQDIASEVEEGEEGSGARLDQAAPTPEKRMEAGDIDNPRTSTGTNPTPGHAVQSSSAADGEPTADEDS